ncbi:MAG: DUF4124 domain-containing protein [Sulfuritalea sp.]|nr:DUF4124 domain-containing protein [Sulfuritalea sp.]
MKTLLLAIPLLLPVAAGANTLYKCVDSSGVLYTNQKPSNKKCAVLSRQSEPAAASNKGARQSVASAPTPRDFPRVSQGEQKARDGDRRDILTKELANELQGAEKARKAILDASGQPPEKLQPLHDTVALHERNVEALKKELAKLR